MSATLSAFLAAVDAIQAEQPTYRLGGKAEDGTCDCIGLIIGALNRCGVKWPGIHGSNWAARNAMAWLLPVSDASDLTVGDIVYKARRPGETGYSLPDRYAADPDRADYYHVGVVRSVSPLRIVHCTSPGGVITDTKLGKWAYRGELSLIGEADDAGKEVAGMETATVTAESGSTVNMRREPHGALVDRVPVGSVVQVMQVTGEPGAQWAQVAYHGKAGWMNVAFLRMEAGTASTDSADDDGEMVTLRVPRTAAEQLMDALSQTLGRG